VLPEWGKKVTNVVPAVFEGGVFRPLEQVSLGENERVYMLLLPDEPAKVAAAQRAILESLIGIGESQETDVAARHDEFLYPRPT
jgi:predicted DNA-binding antitoxin AbrB/MazE fold protein